MNMGNEGEGDDLNDTRVSGLSNRMDGGLFVETVDMQKRTYLRSE